MNGISEQGQNSEPLLEVSNLQWRDGRRPLLQDISLCLHAGESVALLGPNGAEKSSLIRLLAGERRSKMGSIRLHGRPLQDWPCRELARIRAVMPQLQLVGFPLRAAEVVALGLPDADRGNVRHPLVAHLLGLLEVAHLGTRYFPSLSGGEQQRVQLARVLAQIWGASRPALLLLDECTSALDPAHQHRILRLVRDITQRDVGVLWAVHDLNLAARYADRIVLMQKGRLVAQGAPQQVLTPEWLARVYGLDAEVIEHGGLVVVARGCIPTGPLLS